MAAKKSGNKGKRYSADEKASILAFIEQQGRGGATAAARKFGVSPLTISSWKKSAASGGASSSRGNSAAVVDKDTVLRDLAGRGFKIVRMMNALTGEVIDEKMDPKIEKLGLEFGAPRGKAETNKTYVVQTNGQVMVTMTLDRLLAITGTKP